MKRLIPVLLAMLLLCGCVSEPEPAQTTAATTEYVAPTEPAGCYLPDSETEIATGGAVREYALDVPDAYAIARMDGDILVFSGSDRTVLTRLTGENLYPIARTELDFCVYPGNATFQITDKGITYCDIAAWELVFLDEDLQEASRMALPENMSGGYVLSENRARLYYCTSGSVRVLDLETGLDRLLKEVSFPMQWVEDTLCGDTVLYCGVCEEDGEEKALFLSTETGELLWERSNDLEITSLGDNYYTRIPDGIMDTYLYGTVNGQTRMLIPSDPWAETCFLPEIHSALTVSGGYGEDMTLELYDLDTGIRSAMLTVTGSTAPVSIVADGDEGYVYFLANDSTGAVVLWRWDPEATPLEDDTVYTGPRYTLQDPDSEGLEQCVQLARDLGESYGVEVLVGMDAVAVEPWDYELYPEYQVPVVQSMLQTLASVLETYPAGFFESLSENPVKICLIRSLTGNAAAGSLESANGVQFWDGADVYVALTAGEMLEQTFYHEIFHIIETRVLSCSNAYDSWDSLNPQGFQYDYDYISNRNRDPEEYLQEDTRAFIDTYSMSYPKEDRARIMEYAAIRGNEALFTSDTMQKKLYTLCLGIREAFGLEEYPNALLWEQYLENSLVP